MRYMNYIICWITVFLQVSGLCIYGQAPATKKLPGSLIYVHTDRLTYLAGESLFFKAYILNNSGSGYNLNSDTLFVALIDRDGTTVSSGKFPVKDKQVSGSIMLSRFLTEGNYILIAYTSGMKYLTPDKIYSGIIIVEKARGTGIRINVALEDTLYSPGNTVTASILSSGRNEKAVSASFTYKLQNTREDLYNGEGKTDRDGRAAIRLKLPEFQNDDTLELLVTSSYRGEDITSGIVIPTPGNYDYLKIHPNNAISTSDNKTLEIQINTDKQQYKRNEKVELCLNVTDDKGVPMAADLSVSVSDLQTSGFPVQNKNTLSGMIRKTGASGYGSYLKWNKFFARCLALTDHYPGHSFIIEGKNDSERINRDLESAGSGYEQPGYPADRKILDIIQQMKPYQIVDGKIMFANRGITSIYYQEGALIIVDGIKRGTDASILSTIPITDIARINVSTNSADIQKYTAMNSNGIIEIYTKNSSLAPQTGEPVNNNKTSAILWTPDVKTDSAGHVCITFTNKSRASGVVISVAGVTAHGLIGESSEQYQVE
jgi:hypothetical protein